MSHLSCRDKRPLVLGACLATCDPPPHSWVRARNHNRRRDHTDELSQSALPQRRLSIKHATRGQWHFVAGGGGTGYLGACSVAKQIAAENTLVINQLKLICGMPKKERNRERGEEGLRLTERSANYEWIFSQSAI